MEGTLVRFIMVLSDRGLVGFVWKNVLDMESGRIVTAKFYQKVIYVK